MTLKRLTRSRGFSAVLLCGGIRVAEQMNQSIITVGLMHNFLMLKGKVLPHKT